VTHHHADHTGGIAELKQKHKCRVVAPSAESRQRFRWSDETVREGDKVKVGKLVANVIETPGHTSGISRSGFMATSSPSPATRCFSIGCGRVIEGTMEMMWASLKKLRDLPGDTRVYCGHEYTLANINFAQTIEPDNAVLKARAAQAASRSRTGEWTIPTTLDEEKAPTRSCAPTFRRSPPRSACRQARRRSVRGSQGEEE
jgi:hydroxyacylglutathione hydrolase